MQAAARDSIKGYQQAFRVEKQKEYGEQVADINKQPALDTDKTAQIKSLQGDLTVLFEKIFARANEALAEINKETEKFSQKGGNRNPSDLTAALDKIKNAFVTEFPLSAKPKVTADASQTPAAAKPAMGSTLSKGASSSSSPPTQPQPSAPTKPHAAPKSPASAPSTKTPDAKPSLWQMLKNLIMGTSSKTKPSSSTAATTSQPSKAAGGAKGGQAAADDQTGLSAAPALSAMLSSDMTPKKEAHELDIGEAALSKKGGPSLTVAADQAKADQNAPKADVDINQQNAFKNILEALRDYQKKGAGKKHPIKFDPADPAEVLAKDGNKITIKFPKREADKEAGTPAFKSSKVVIEKTPNGAKISFDPKKIHPKDLASLARIFADGLGPGAKVTLSGLDENQRAIVQKEIDRKNALLPPDKQITVKIKGQDDEPEKRQTAKPG